MKKLIPVLLVALLMTSCFSIQKNMQRGNYDGVINKAVKKLIAKKELKWADAMDQAYRLANERDLESITYLEREGNPDKIEDLLRLYSGLKARQAQVRRVVPFTIEGKTFDYERVDYDAKIIANKRKAADEHYETGKKLMNEARSKFDYRDAHARLLRADELGGHNYPDIEQMIFDSRMKGISRAIVVPMNMDPDLGIPQIDLDYLISFDKAALEGNPWVEYHLKHAGGDMQYDYEVYVRILSIEVSDNNEKETKQEFTRKSTTKFDYVLDAAGNVMRDTAGNDIKVYKDVNATLLKKERNKNCIFRGEVETISISGEPRGSLAKVPFSAKSDFVNNSYTLIGDPEAVDAGTMALTKQEAVPFPTETDLIKLCIEDAKPTVQGIMLDQGRRYIK